MSDRMLVDAQLKRLMAAFPSFKPRAGTLEIYAEFMMKLSPDALRRCVSNSIEFGGKFPAVADLRKRTGNGGENVSYEPKPPEPEEDRDGGDWIIDAVGREPITKDRRELFRKHFAIGRERMERHLEEQIARGAEFRAAHPDQARY